MFKEGQKVRVLNDGFDVEDGFYAIGHFGDVGSIATVVDVHDRESDGEDVRIDIKVRDRESGIWIIQTVRPESIEALIETAVDLPVTNQSESTKTTPVPRAKVVYSVEDDEYEYTLTHDRDYAREVKADLGGKRKGVRIIRYVATHEIR